MKKMIITIHLLRAVKIAMALGIILAMASCGKEKKTELQAPGTQTAKKLTKFYSASDPNDAEFYTYDAGGRVSKIENPDELTTFTYSGNTVEIKEYRKTENNKVVFNITGTLDAQGRLISATGTSAYNGPTYNVELLYEYNAEGYLSKYTRSFSDGNSYKYEYSYTNGDMTKKRYYSNGVFQNEFVAEYYTDRPDKNALTTHYATGYMMKGLEGKPNNHLEKSSKMTRADGSTAWSYNRDFELDSDGYPVKTILTGTNNSAWNYSYN